MDRNPTNRRCYARWVVKSFTALDDWVIVWDGDSGAPAVEPCPGVLVEEATEQYISWDAHDGNGGIERLSRVEPLPEPEDRTSFAYIEGAEVMSMADLSVPADEFKIMPRSVWESTR
ncbi:hypothetical protein ABQE69_17395 [Mycolicibacillus trivialis]